MIHLLDAPATRDQLEEMLEEWITVVKVAIDVERGVLAGGGEYHADCERVLLANGSDQENIWGAGWLPDTRTVFFESLINVRPGCKNPSMEILDHTIRARVAEIVTRILDSK